MAVNNNWIVGMHKWADEERGNNKSQGAQDKYLDKIFEVIGRGNGYFVEIGFNEENYSKEGSGSNSMNLYDNGWRGLLLDSEYENPLINLRAHYIFSDNIT